jgi:hypothetical protein
MDWEGKIICSKKELIELNRYCKIYSEERYEDYYTMLSNHCSIKELNYLDFKDFVIYNDKLIQVLFQVCSLIEKRLKGNLANNEELKKIFEPKFDKNHRKKRKYTISKKINESGFSELIYTYKKLYKLNRIKCEKLIEIRNDIMHSNKVEISKRNSEVEILLSFLNDQKLINEKINKINCLFDKKINGNKKFAELYRLKIKKRMRPIDESI